jgi:hypothetical protein
MLALEEERGDGAQRNATAWHAAELIIDIMARRPLLWLVAALVLAVPLAYGVYPVRRAIDGVGTIEPLFEDLVLITPDESGIVTRMRVSLHQDVARGEPLFEYLTDGWAVKAYGGMSKPSGSSPEPPPLVPEWYQEMSRRRVARANALRHWTGRVHSRSHRPLAWEHLLAQRLNSKISQEDNLTMVEAQAAENVRLGRQDANVVQVFDRGVGMYRDTEDGRPFSSAVAGRVHSLWITRRLQFNGPSPLGEIMRPETPHEVFGLIPIPPAALRELSGWRATLTPPGERTPIPLAVTTIEIGRVPIDVADATLIVPNLPVTRESVFVRLRLAEAVSPERLGAPLLITLTSPPRPRLWLWLSGASLAAGGGRLAAHGGHPAASRRDLRRRLRALSLDDSARLQHRDRRL